MGNVTFPDPSFTVILLLGVDVEAIMVIPPVNVVPAASVMFGILSILSGSKQLTGATKFKPMVCTPELPAKFW